MQDPSKITQEMSYLQKESDFFKYLLPEKIDCGIIFVDLKGIKKVYCDLIDNLMETFKKTIYDKFCKLLLENEKLVNQILTSLDKIPTTIEDYINVSKYIRGEEFKNNLKKLKSDFKIIQFLYETVNNYLIQYDEVILQVYVESCIWIKSIKKKRNNTKFKLIEIRPKFKSVIEDNKNDLFNKFDTLLLEIEPLKSYNDYSNAYNYANNSKNIFNQLNTLVEKANLLNYQENFLNYQQTDFESINKLTFL